MIRELVFCGFGDQRDLWITTPKISESEAPLLYSCGLSEYRGFGSGFIFLLGDKATDGENVRRVFVYQLS